MKQSEALGIVGIIGAAFRTEMGDETTKLWARELVDYEVEDAAEAVTILARGLRFMPSLADCIAGIRDCRNVRLAERPALPRHDHYPFARFLHDHAEMGDRVKALQIGGADHSKACCPGPVIPHTFARLLSDEMKGAPS